MQTKNGPRIVSDLHLCDNSTVNGGPPVHITKVNRKGVEVTSGPSTAQLDQAHKRIIQKVTKVFKNEANGDETIVRQPRVLAPRQPVHSSPDSDYSHSSRRPVMQGPPPSPPESDVDVEESADSITTETEVTAETIEVDEKPADGPTLSPVNEVTAEQNSPSRPSYTHALTAEPSDLGASNYSIASQRTPSPVNRVDYFTFPDTSPSRPTSTNAHLSVPSRRRVSNSSNSSRTGSLAIVRANRLAQQRTSASPVDGTHAENAEYHAEASPDDVRGHFEPSTSLSAGPRMSRRMTNPSPPMSAAATFPSRSPLTHSHSTFSTSNNNLPVFTGTALDPDILAQTEVIRRERLERRRKKAEAEAGAAAATAAPAKATPEAPIEKQDVRKEKEKEEATKVLVGNLIGEDHVNYVLMYNMLTGIRIGVSARNSILRAVY